MRTHVDQSMYSTAAVTAGSKFFVIKIMDKTKSYL